MLGHWTTTIKEIPNDAIGFVYLIKNIRDGRYYYGMKMLKYSWKNYTSSSEKLKKEIKENKDDWSFTILSFHNSKSTLKLEEAKHILKHYKDKLNLNGIINLRINLTHLKEK